MKKNYFVICLIIVLSIIMTSCIVINEKQTAETVTEKIENNESGSSNSANTSVRKMLDDYESFMNEYIDFMKNYNNSDNALSMLSDYSKMLSKYAEVTKSINSIDTKSLSTEDYAYYLDVTNRVLKKMTELYE